MDELSLAKKLLGTETTTEEKTEHIDTSTASIVYMVAVTSSSGGEVILKNENEAIEGDWEEGDYVEIDEDGDFEEYESDDDELEDVDDTVVDMTEGDGVNIEESETETLAFTVSEYQVQAQAEYEEEVEAEEDELAEEGAEVTDDIDDGDATELPDDGEAEAEEDELAEEGAEITELDDAEYILTDDNSDDESDEVVPGAEISDGYTVAECIGVVNEGDRVAVMVQNGQMTVLGVAGSGDEQKAEITHTIETLEATNIVVENLQATKANITDLEVTNANIADLQVTKANISDLNVTNAKVNKLEADVGNIADLEAFNATIENLKTNKLDVQTAQATYANIDFSNINKAAIEEFFSKSGIIENLVVGEGTITGNLVGVTIKGDMIEAGTVVADKLVVKGENGLYYKLNTNGVTTEAEQTDYNSLNGNIITAQSITATKIAVDDLVAFDATIGGFNITDNSLYSGVKESVNNTTRGVYLGSDGQMAVGDASNFIKYYKDENGKFRLGISAQSITIGASSTDVESAIIKVKDTADGAKTAIDNLSVGGRNLLRFTSDLPIDYYREKGIGSWLWEGLTETDNGLRMDVHETSDSTSFWVPLISTGALQNGEEVTLSFDYRGDFTRFGSLHYVSPDYNTTSMVTDWELEVSETEWKHFSKTFTVGNENIGECSSVLLFYGHSIAYNNGTWFEVKHKSLKLEKGNIPTGWTAASEDTDASIEEINTNFNNMAESISASFVGEHIRTTTDETVHSYYEYIKSDTDEYIYYYINESNETIYFCETMVEDTPVIYQVTESNGTYTKTETVLDVDIPSRTILTTSPIYYCEVTDGTISTVYQVTESNGVYTKTETILNIDPTNSNAVVELLETVPNVPYQSGDIWITASGYTKYCVTEAKEDDMFNESDWTESTEGIIQSVENAMNDIQNAVDTAKNAKDSADETGKSLEDIKTTVQILVDRISKLVVGEGTTLYDQNDEGWTYSFADTRADIDALLKDIEKLDDLAGNVDDLNNSATEFTVLKEYIRIIKIVETDGNKVPCLELGETDSPFRVQITNKIIRFMNSRNNDYVVQPNVLTTTGEAVRMYTLNDDSVVYFCDVESTIRLVTKVNDDYVISDTTLDVDYTEWITNSSELKGEKEYYCETKPVAYMSGDTLNIDKAIIDTTLGIGGLEWSIRNNGNVGILWKGVDE